MNSSSLTFVLQWNWMYACAKRVIMVVGKNKLFLLCSVNYFKFAFWKSNVLEIPVSPAHLPYKNVLPLHTDFQVL